MNMNTITKAVAVATVAFTMSAGSALAVVVDFTTGSANPVTNGSLTATLTSNGSLSFTTYDGGSPEPAVPLAFNTDGVGVGDDEITNPGEWVTVTFNKTVEITTAYFLDLFRFSDSDFEVAEIFVGDDSVLIASSVLSATAAPGSAGFGAFGGLSLIGKQFTFRATSGNDTLGGPDYALAGLELNVVPVPPAILLFGSGVLGLGFLARNRKSKASVSA